MWEILHIVSDIREKVMSNKNLKIVCGYLGKINYVMELYNWTPGTVGPYFIDSMAARALCGKYTGIKHEVRKASEK